MKIRKGDNVIIISGKDKGKRGTVTAVLTDIDRVVVEGINVKKKYQHNRESKKDNMVVDVEYPIHVSNVALFDDKVGKGSKVKIERDDKGKKTRVLKKSGQVIK